MSDAPMFNNRPSPPRRSDPMASTRRSMLRDERRRERESLTAPEIATRAKKIIRAKFDRDGQEAEISMDDFRRDNLPMHLISQPLVRSWIRSVQADMAAEGA